MILSDIACFISSTTTIFFCNRITGPIQRSRLEGVRSVLTHWGRDKMVIIFQPTFSNAFSWMKMHKLRLKFHLFFPKDPINNIPTFQHCCLSGAEPLSEPIMVSLLTHICVTRTQWVQSLRYCGNSTVGTPAEFQNYVNITLSISRFRSLIERSICCHIRYIQIFLFGLIYTTAFV